MTNALELYVGKGLGFPWQINFDGGIDLVEGSSLVEESIKTILSYTTNRFFDATFKNKIELMLEEPNNIANQRFIRANIIDRITQLEPRVELSVVEVFAKDNQVAVYLEYQIKKTEIKETLVYPFFKELR